MRRSIVTERNGRTIAKCSDPTCYDKNWEYVLERAIKRDPIEEKRAASRVILRALLELLNRDVQVRFSQIPYTRVPKDFLKSPETWISNLGRGLCLVGWPKDVPQCRVSSWPAHISICVSKLIFRGLIRIDSPYSRGDIYGEAKMRLACKGRACEDRFIRDQKVGQGPRNMRQKQNTALAAIAKPMRSAVSKDQIVQFNWETPMSGIRNANNETSGPSIPRKISNSDIASMSDKELEELASQLGLPRVPG